MKTLLALLLPWLSGLTLHPASGPPLHIALPADHAATVRLLGPAADGGWALVDERGDRRVVLLQRGHRLRAVRSVADPQDGTSFLLASDRRRVVELDAPTTRRTDLWAFDLRGRVVGHERLPRPADLLGYDGTTVWYATSQRTFAWIPGEQATPVAEVSAVAVDPAHDVLFTYEPQAGTYGPTSLAAPGTQTWSFPSSLFTPRAVSPDGTYVAGLAGGRANHVQLRRMSDGSVVSDWSRHLAFDRPLAWADADHVVSVLRSRRGWALLRCGVGADCVRASALSGDPLSLPFQEVPSR
jgi:hypothetical protein